MTTARIFVLLSALAISTATNAATTEWMSQAKLNSYTATSKSDRWYPTRIECKDEAGKPLFRLATKSFTEGTKPFYKWNWVFGKSSELQTLVSRLKRSDRPDLKYHIVHKSTYKGQDGIGYGCAIAYR